MRAQVAHFNTHKPGKSRPLTLGEHLCMLGITLRASGIESGHHELFGSTMSENDDFPPPCFGARYSVSKGRYEMWRRNITLAPFKKNSTDPWKPQRKFWEDLSKSMAAVMAPSWLIILDESMSAWTGRGFQGATEYKEGFCPHKSWVPRKPEPTGVEYKTVCCAESGVMLAAEAEEGKTHMKEKEFTDAHRKPYGGQFAACEAIFCHTEGDCR